MQWIFVCLFVCVYVSILRRFLNNSNTEKNKFIFQVRVGRQLAYSYENLHYLHEIHRKHSEGAHCKTQEVQAHR